MKERPSALAGDPSAPFVPVLIALDEEESGLAVSPITPSSCVVRSGLEQIKYVGKIIAKLIIEKKGAPHEGTAQVRIPRFFRLIRFVMRTSVYFPSGV